MGFGITSEIKAEALRSLAFGGIGAAFSAIGGSFSNPIRMLMIHNTTDVGLIFSLDGATDNFFLPVNGQIIFDASSNLAYEDGVFFSSGDSVSVKHAGTPPTSGTVYVSSFYADGVV